MSETSVSLLDQLKTGGDELTWRRLVDFYSPLIRGWLLRYGMSSQDAEDISQDVMAVVVRRIKEFDRQRTGSFRSWLRSITVNCVRDFLRKRRRRPLVTGGQDLQRMLDELADPQSGLSGIWNQQHDQYVLDRLLEQIKPSFAANTWTAFQRLTIDGASAQEVADELGVTVNSVFISKSRILAKLRELSQGLVDQPAPTG